jgi:uncharacterized membrane protein YdjX (TVP38/TMEM64 family)
MLISLHPQLAALYLIIAKILFAIFLLPATPLTLLAGSLYGKLNGTIISLVGNIIGANAAFLISRYLFQDYVVKKFLPKYPKIKEYEELLFVRGFKTVMFMRLVPLFPFNALNYLLGVTQVKFKDYFLATIVGIIPGTFAFVYFGDSLKMFSFINIIIAIIAIVVLSSIGRFWKLK